MPITHFPRRLRGLVAVGTLSLAMAPAGQPASAAESAALVGGWRFDEPGGQSALDDGPYGLDGRLGSTDGVDASDPARIDGLSDGALHFEDSYVRLPNTSALDLQHLSVEAVVRAPASPGSWRYIVSRGARGCFAGSYGLYSAKSGGIALYVYDGRQYVVSATARPENVWDGAWHHVAGTFDGQSLRLYVDGRLVGAPLEVPLRIDYVTTSTSTYFGQYVGSCQLALHGDVDMVRLWSGALSPDAVAAAAAAPPAGGALTAASQGTVTPHSRGAGTLPRRPSTAGAPARACVVRPSRKRITAGRRTSLVVRVSLRRRPLATVPVTVRRAGRHKVIARSRTGANGRARLRFRVRRSGRLRVSAAALPRCAPAYVRVRSAR
jgi:Concanavalin A-like lectin/glucanases superfamily